MAKIKITENILKHIVSESVKKIIKESFNFMSSGIFDDNQELEYLEELVYKFANQELEVDNSYEVSNWEEFIEGVKAVYFMCNEKAEFDRLNILEKYKEIDWEDYESSSEFDDYVNRNINVEYDDSDMSDYINYQDEWKNLPNPEVIKNLIPKLSNFIEKHYEYLIEYKTREYYSEIRYCNKLLSEIR